MYFRAAFAGVVVLGLASLARPVSADVSLDVRYGWGDLTRAGRWTPIIVRAIDSQTRSVLLEVTTPRAGSSAMRVQQYFTISSVPTTLQVYLPIENMVSDPLTVAIRDPDSHKTLARFPADPNGFSSIRLPNDSSAGFIGVSGIRTSLAALNGQIGKRLMDVGYLGPELLPTTPLGYDCLDLLVLNRPDLVRLDIDVQSAILDWVRAGGNLLLWPSDDSVPESSPLMQALPCKIEGIKDYLFDKDDHRQLGLQVDGLRGRQLVGRDGAERIELMRKSSVDAWRSRIGLGTIVVAPIDPSQLCRNSTAPLQAKIWRPLVAGMGLLVEERESPLQQGPPLYNYYGIDPALSRETRAMGTVLDTLGDIPGAGQFGFSYVAVVLLGMMVIVGPVDWFVLRWLGRQPWTWITTAGWIAVITLGALFIGHWFRSGDLHYRTLRLVDQAGDQTVGTVDIACIYSPRTTDYHLDAPAQDPSAAAPAGADSAAAAGQTSDQRHQPPVGWWQPASANYGGGPTMSFDLDFHQTQQGNVPESMYINVWSLRFLRADVQRSGPAMLSADLTATAGHEGVDPSTSHITGTITNLTDHAMTEIRIRTREGFALNARDANASNAAEPSVQRLADPGVPVLPVLAAHASVEVNLVMQGDGRLTSAIGAVPGTYNPTPLAAHAGLWLAAGELAGRRAEHAETLIGDGAHVCIYAQIADPASPATLREPDALQQHYEILRAILPIKGDRLPGRPSLKSQRSSDVVE